MDNNRIMNFLSKDEALLITGSLNCNPADRSLSREDIHPVQIYMDGELKPISFFDSWGDFGASSFTWLKQNSEKFLFSTGDSTYLFDTSEDTWESLAWLKTKDVHEIEQVNNTIWLSNTGYDEALGIKSHNGRVNRRLKLEMFKRNNQIKNVSFENEEIQAVDSFHCNQITQAYNGELIALVHHTSGQQIIRKIANKVIKNQGNGGVICLESGRSINLQLKSPHSIRRINDQYWIFDSGNARIHIYDQEWNLLNKVPCAGFGRGAAVTQTGVFCAGISETRKRYLNLLNGAKKVPNMVQFFSTCNHKLLAEMVIRDVEQINNIYVVSKEKIKNLLQLDKNYSASLAVTEFVRSSLSIN